MVLNDLIVQLGKSKTFRAGLLVRLLLIGLVFPYVQSIWFVPFLLDFLRKPSIDPWTTWIAANGDPMAFPYGPVMYLAHLPGVATGGALDHLLGTTFLAAVGFGLSILFFDLACLSVLTRILEGDLERVLRYWWLSPLVLYICYWHGQTDMVPVFLLLASLERLKRLEARAAGAAIGLAIAAKLSMVLPVPFLLLYLFRNKRLAHLAPAFMGTAAAVACAMQGPYLFFSPGVKQMLLGSPEIQKVYQLSISIGPTLTVYVLPFTYLLLLYAAWRIGRMSFELLFSFLGTAFFLVLLLTPASIGWFLWAVPFLVAHQISGGINAAAMVAAFSAMLIGFHLGHSTGAVVRVVGWDAAQPLSTQLPWLTAHLQSLWLTVLAAIGGVLTIRLFRTGVQKNDYFRLSRKPVAIGVAGDSGSGKDTLSAALAGLFGELSVASVHGDDYHVWDRHAPMWRALTHLNPQANNLVALSRDVLALMDGKSIVCRHYDHITGHFSHPARMEKNDVVIVNGLHALYDPLLVQRFDVRVFLAMDEELRRFLKLHRDVGERGQNENQVLESIERRYEDAVRYVHPQQRAADVIFSLEPVHRRSLVHSASPANIPLRLRVQLRRGLYCEQLERTLMGLCGLYIQTTLADSSNGAELRVEGDVTREDMAAAAQKLVPRTEELLALEPKWQDGMLGVMQLITLMEIAEALRERV